jgi:Zinc carboxypeptidase
MRRAEYSRLLTIWLVMGAGTVAQAQPSPHPSGQRPLPAQSGCKTVHGSVHFDFDGASRSSCYVEDDRTVSIVVTPEHLPPINPSPWYAFRYTAAKGGKLTVHVRYLGAKHRYAPKWQGKGDATAMSVAVAQDGSAVAITLPPGEGVVSSQPLVTGENYKKLLRRIANAGGGRTIRLGHSHDQRAVEGVRLGQADAPRLIILLGRQHPPEVTGAIALDAFALKIAALLRGGAIDAQRYQVLIVPLLNPDGVARGHWRANLGGVDLNRDWGAFSQPETRAVRDWLARLPSTVKPALMLDFHSTQRNIFYVQGDSAAEAGKAFLSAWLGGKESALADYPFSIEPRDANPGAGTTKNWFHATYAIPAYTYEVGDGSNPATVRNAAELLAQSLVPALDAALK